MSTPAALQVRPARRANGAVARIVPPTTTTSAGRSSCVEGTTARHRAVAAHGAADSRVSTSTRARSGRTTTTGVDPAVGDALVSEACQRLVEHGPIERCGPGGTPRRPLRAGGRATPAASPASPGTARRRNGRDEHDGWRLDRGRSSPTGIGH